MYKNKTLEHLKEKMITKHSVCCAFAQYIHLLLYLQRKYISAVNFIMYIIFLIKADLSVSRTNHVKML